MGAEKAKDADKKRCAMHGLILYSPENRIPDNKDMHNFANERAVLSLSHTHTRTHKESLLASFCPELK